MEISLLLLPDEDAKPSTKRNDDYEWVQALIIILILLLIVLPLFWKFVLILLLIVIGGTYLNHFSKQEESIPETAYIFLSSEKILTQVADEVTFETKLSDVISIYVWSDYYPGYISNGDTIHNGTMILTLNLCNGETLSHPSMIRNELQYNGVRKLLEEWYKSGISIEETITIGKQKGILLKPFSNYSYKQIQDMKMELDLD